MTQWQPVLDDVDVERAERVIDEIALALSAESMEPLIDDASALTDGRPGWAIFFASLDVATPHRGHEATARRLLNEAVAGSEAVSGSQALFGGIMGLGWTLQYLASTAHPEHTSALDDFDSALRTALDVAPVATVFDLISGLVGLGVYALERLPAPAARDALERIVVWLDATAEHTPDGIAWRAPAHQLTDSARVEFPAGCYFTGVAHGTAGVVGLLASILLAGIAPAVTGRLLDGAVSWVLAQELHGQSATFPLQLMGETRSSVARSAWCAGAPGIPTMILRASKGANEPAWQARAMAMARTVARQSAEEARVKDACLCHGAAGLGLIYARWFNATADEFFRHEAARWFRCTLDFHRPGEGIGGYATTNSPKGRQEAAPGLLFGAAGVGLALLAATTAIEPAWDRVFLISDPHD